MSTKIRWTPSSGAQQRGARWDGWTLTVNTAYRGSLLRHVLHQSDSRAVVVAADFLERIHRDAGELETLEKVLVLGEMSDPPSFSIPVLAFDVLLSQQAPLPSIDMSPRDSMAILYSSGTTGVSKGILLCHNYFWFAGNQSLTLRGVTADDRIYTCLPLFHGNAQMLSTMPALLAGATLVLDTQFSASTFWERLRASRATQFNYIGGMIPILMKQPPSAADRQHAVKMATGAAAPRDQLLAFEQRFGVRLLEGYGQTENCVALVNPVGAPRVGSIGLPICGYDADVVNDDDEPVPPGTIGELVVRPQHPFIMMDGYYKMPQATLEMCRNLWMHTGDLVTRDEDGYYYFVDRKKDAMRRRGENISAFEVEAAVNSHPAVLESAAIAVPSEVGEDEVMVCVVLKPGQTLAALDLIKHCEELIAYFAVPRYVDFCTELPKTPTFRVEKYRLREQGVTPTTWDREKAGYTLRR
ncbi:MAG: AMP-binding protein [Burkholderiales bacterium]|nr:AMP-binding protein [Burkholderiales bacterium]